MSSDGKTVVYVDRDGNAFVLLGDAERGRGTAGIIPGPNKRIAKQVFGGLSAFAPDGSSLLLRTMKGATHNGVLVLRVPTLQRIYESDRAEHVHYASARTIVFHDDGVPMSLDVTSGKVTTLGPKLAGFACPDEELYYRSGTRPLEAACPSKRWTRVLGVEQASTRWVLADIEGVSSMIRVRAVDPKTAASVTLFELGADAGHLQANLSPDGGTLCMSKVTHKGKPGVDEHRELRCGPVAGPHVVLYSGSGRASTSFVDPGRVAVTEDHTMRIVELKTGATIELAAGRLHAFHSGWRVFGRDAYTRWGTEAVWIDLEAGTWATLGETGQSGPIDGIDLTSRRRVFVTRYEKDSFRYDLYEVRWK